MSTEQITSLLQNNRNRLRDYGVRDISLFGSVVRGEEHAQSDVDLLIEFEPDAKIGLFAFARLQRMLTEILGCNVDLVTPDALHKELKDAILKEAVHAF